MSKRKKEYATDVLKREIEERKIKLKRCPFCNGEAKVKEFEFGLNAIYCDSCGARITAFYMNNAIIAWNKRVDVAKTDECCKKSCKDENATCKKNLQLTRSDIEKMVKFEWRKDEEDERVERLSISNNVYFEASGVFGSCRMVVSEDNREYDSMAVVSDGTMDMEKQKQNAQVFLVDFICSALRVEEEK